MRLPLINIRSIEQFEMALFIIYFLLMVKQFSGVTLIFPQLHRILLLKSQF